MLVCRCVSPDGAHEMRDDSWMQCMSCKVFRLGLSNGNVSDLDNIFRVSVGEALKLVLVQVHDEQLVRGRQVHRHLGELLVEVGDIAARFLPRRRSRRQNGDREGERERRKESAEEAFGAFERQVRKNKVNNKQESDCLIQ